jgi:hypothetical protein
MQGMRMNGITIDLHALVRIGKKTKLGYAVFSSYVKLGG